MASDGSTPAENMLASCFLLAFDWLGISKDTRSDRGHGLMTARRSSSRPAERWPRLNFSPDPHCSNFRIWITGAAGCFSSDDSLPVSCSAM